MQTLYGRKVQISQPYPRVQCSPAFAAIQSPELVAETNAWMASFFGHETLIPDGVVYELNRDTLVMTQSTYRQLLRATRTPTEGTQP
jgi:hypothetical protein